jgi:hypothetical protein
MVVNITKTVSLLLIILNSGCSLFGIRKEETPNYQVLQKEDNKEVRQYQAYIVAQTTVEGDYKEAQTQAFRRLAGYIFGKNQADDKLPMTAPVTYTPASEKIAMTAPVTQQSSEQGWVMTFMMPSKYKSIEELPKPQDERVVLMEVPEQTIAAIRFTGFRGQERNKRKGDELLQWLNEKGEYEAMGEPYFAGYDPPWTLPFFRRNEMLVPLTPTPSNAP